MAPSRKVSVLRDRVATLEEELRTLDQLQLVQQRVQELEMEVKCKDALVKARQKREAEDNATAMASVLAKETPVKDTTLASQLGNDWVTIDVGKAAKTGQQQPVTTQRSVSSIGTATQRSSRGKVTRRAASTMPLATSIPEAEPVGIPKNEAGVSLRPVMPPGTHLTFFTGHSAQSTRQRRLTQRSRAPTSCSASTLGTPLATPLARMDGPMSHCSAPFSRYHNKNGVVLDQASAYGQSAAMGMVMHPPKPTRKLKQGPRVPRVTEMRVLPLNEFDNMHQSNHAALSHVGYPMSKLT